MATLIPSSDRSTFIIAAHGADATSSYNVQGTKYNIASKAEDGRCVTFCILPSSGDNEIQQKSIEDDDNLLVKGQIVFSRIDDPNVASNEELVLYVARHGVPSLDEWYSGAFGDGQLPTELAMHLGLVRTWVATAPKRASDNRETVVVIHLLKKSCMENMKELTAYDKPPFVGGPDFIGNGLVIPPFDLNLYAHVVLQSTYE